MLTLLLFSTAFAAKFEHYTGKCSYEGKERDLQQQHTDLKSRFDCEEYCLGSHGCLAYEWNSAAQSCDTHARPVDGGDADTNVDCYIMEGDMKWCEITQENYPHGGSQVGFHKDDPAVPDMDTCQELCDAEPPCNALVWEEKSTTCWMYGNTPAIKTMPRAYRRSRKTIVRLCGDGSCTSDNDCEAGEEFCFVPGGKVTPKCQEATDEGGRCKATRECKGGLTCLKGSRQCAKEGSCLADSDCPASESCVDGACARKGNVGDECEADSDCKEALFCNSAGECAEEGSCASDSDCGSDQLCKSQECLDKGDVGDICETDPDCKDALFCNSASQCAEEGSCASDDDCEEQECKDNQCVDKATTFDCQLGRGKGPGHTNELLGKTDDKDACAILVSETKPDANAATWMTGSRKCWADFDQSDIVAGGLNDRYTNCLLKPYTSVDTRTRTRTRSRSMPTTTTRSPYTVTCQTGRGAGSGNGSLKKEYLGRVDGMTECVELVKEMRPDANGATWITTGPRKCWSETGQTKVRSGSESDDRFENCWTNRPAPLTSVEGVTESSEAAGRTESSESTSDSSSEAESIFMVSGEGQTSPLLVYGMACIGLASSLNFMWTKLTNFKSHYAKIEDEEAV